MTDIPMNADAVESFRPGREASQWLRTVVMAVLVLAAVVIVWQVVKAAFHLDEIKLPNVSDIIGALFQPLQSAGPGA